MLTTARWNDAGITPALAHQRRPLPSPAWSAEPRLRPRPRWGRRRWGWPGSPGIAAARTAAVRPAPRGAGPAPPRPLGGSPPRRPPPAARAARGPAAPAPAAAG